MEPNPYQSPGEEQQAAVPRLWNLLLKGPILSFVGVAGVAVVGWSGPTISVIGALVAYCCLPGLLLSIVSYWHRAHWAAFWGVAAGLFGSLYLGTFWHFLIQAPFVTP